jgi:hypothetical protein
MSEDKGELAKSSFSELQPASDTPADQVTALSRVEERIAKATSPQEAFLWTQIREEIIKQNEIAKEGDHRRLLQKILVLRRIGLSVAAFTIGVVLFSNGSTEAGLLVLGAFLYELAPDLVKEAFIGRGKGRGNDN